jgi:hypothetical protein
MFLGRGSSKWVQGRRRGVDDRIPHDMHFGVVWGSLARLVGRMFQRKVRVLACQGCRGYVGEWFVCVFRSGVVEMGPRAPSGR